MVGLPRFELGSKGILDNVQRSKRPWRFVTQTFDDRPGYTTAPTVISVDTISLLLVGAFGITVSSRIRKRFIKIAI